MAKKPPIKSLKLCQFRGASQEFTLTFPETSISLIFGENGTGKSSIIDGLDFILRCDPGSIQYLSGASAVAHLATLNSKPKDIVAELALADGTILKTSMPTREIKQTITGKSPCPHAVFLRRAKILKLVIATPSVLSRQ